MEPHMSAFEECSKYKNDYMQNLDEKMENIQNEIMVIQKNFELLSNLVSNHNASHEQNSCVQELVSINQELLLSCEEKEFEFNATRSEIERTWKRLEANIEEREVLLKELTDAKKEMFHLKNADDAIKSKHHAMKRHLLENEHALSKHEEAVEMLTKHLFSAAKWQDELLEQDIRLQVSLKGAFEKEHTLDVQLHQSWKAIEELEAKLRTMESEIFRTRADLAVLKEQNNLLVKEVEMKDKKSQWLQKELMETHCHMWQLEDEIMEREGQISILCSSYGVDAEF
eukprot:TRINITY_DN13326_c0_g1_i1.p1 TRINITY_DN13326_c0_g1~~TRINITY_DN13326_c0_g1_i1.p1  ORF type:complete len:284 (+),score=84.26 TRINITY_DN13326_c0_g1_i1:459-1310(+)